MLFSNKADLAVGPTRCETGDTTSHQQSRSAQRGHGTKSFFARASQGLVAALLASPLGAQARPTAPSVVPGLPSGAARHLQANCNQGGWVGPVAGTFPEYASDTSLAQVSSDFAWTQARNNSCVAGGVESAPLNMTNLPLTLGFSNSANVHNAIGSIPSNAIKLIEKDLGALAQFINLQVEIPSNAGTALPNVVFVQQLDSDESSPWVSRQIQSQGNVTAVVGCVDPDSTDNKARLSALGGALGLVSPGAFTGSNLASVTTTSTNVSCTNPTRFGALDLAALAARYGLSAKAAGNQAITLTEDFGSGGIITSQAGNNTLSAVYDGNFTVQLSMLDDGSWPSLVGNTAVLLAPGSVVTHADLSRTPVAMIIGNNHTNYIHGSGAFSGDTIRVGSGLTYLTGGTDNASVVMNYPSSTVVWPDYNSGELYVAGDVYSDTQPSMVATAGPHGLGTQLIVNGTNTILLPNIPFADSGDYPDPPGWSSDDYSDYFVPVACSSLLDPIDSAAAEWLPPPPSPPAPPPAPPPPIPTANPSTPSGGGSSGSGGCSTGCNNVPGASGWIDTNFP